MEPLSVLWCTAGRALTVVAALALLVEKDYFTFCRKLERCDLLWGLLE